MTVVFVSKIEAALKNLVGEGWYVCENGMPTGKPFLKAEDAEAFLNGSPSGIGTKLRDWMQQKGMTKDTGEGGAPPPPTYPKRSFRP